MDKKLQGFQLVAQEKLQAIICSIPGKKNLILEQSLIKPLEHICSASWLRLKGILHIYKFNEENPIPSRPDPECVQVFMMLGKLECFRSVLRHIHAEAGEKALHEGGAAIKHYHIVCVPNCFAYFATILEEEGLYGFVELHRYNWDFIYLDRSLLSMELPNMHAALFMRGDTSLLPSVAQSLRILQMIIGQPEVTVTFGENAESIYRILQAVGPLPRKEAANEDLSALLIIDRDKDYTSSLLTPAIYAGLLLEVFQHRAGEIVNDPHTNKVNQQKLDIFQLPPKAATTSKKPPQKPAVLRMNSSCDEIYADNRYKHFSQASSAVRAQAKAIGVEVQKLNSLKLEEMHDYVARKLPKITDLKMKVTRHLNASEKIIEMLGAKYRKVLSLEEDILNASRKKILSEIDELLTTDGQRYNTVRLLCLLHHCAGIAADELSSFVRNYCNYFGLRYLEVFQQLANAGLLPPLEEDAKQTNKPAKILSNLPIPKFQQTEFQANANRLKLIGSTAAAAAAASDPASSPGSPNANEAGHPAACPSYVFNGIYIPLVAQLCSFLLKSHSAEDFSTKLGMIDKIRMHFPAAAPEEAQTVKMYAGNVKQCLQKDIFPLQKRNVFVFVVGGVTYAEIGACDLVSRLTDSTIVVGSDALISGSDLIAGAF